MALHAGIGERARQQGIDRMFAVGPLSAAAIKAFGERGEHYADKAALTAALKQQLHSGVTCLIKGSRSAGMDQVVAALRGSKGNGEGASDAA
jgi:UDP-N-acetylmuramoyl-tripeptide--D-alanyl-D-alanine ligase